MTRISDLQALLIIGVVALTTYLIRLLPFLIFKNSKAASPSLLFINKYFPPAVIAILVVFCLKTVSLDAPLTSLAQLLAVGIVAALHAWKRNNFLSIGAGTVFYMIIIQVVLPLLT